MRRIAAPLLLLASASACAGGPPPDARGPVTPPSVVATGSDILVHLGDSGERAVSVLDAPPERLWALLPGVYERLGIPAEVRDADARAYGTRRFTGARLAGQNPGDFVRCGAQGGARSASMSQYRLRLSIVSSMEAAPGGGTRLVTEVSGSGTPVEGTSTAAVRCVSTGALEQRIHTLVTLAAEGA